MIPAGKFLMGSPAGEKDRYDNEGPQHQVTVPDFALGKYEVTVADYHRFVDETGHEGEVVLDQDRAELELDQGHGCVGDA